MKEGIGYKLYLGRLATPVLTDLQAQQQAFGNQGESGPVCGEEHQPLLLKEAGQHLRRRDSLL